MATPLHRRLLDRFGNEGAVANAHVLRETRENDERTIAQLTDRLAIVDQRPVTAA